MAGHDDRQPPRKRPLWPWVFGGLVLIVVLGIGGSVAFAQRVARRVEEGSKYAVGVTYRVEGSGSSVAIQYTPGIGYGSTDTATTLPWSKTVSTGGTVSLTATNDRSGGTITCRILANGKQIAEQTATGPSASAICTGDAGLAPAR